MLASRQPVFSRSSAGLQPVESTRDEERHIRVGVIGRGFGARVVAPAFSAVDGCEVVGVVSPRDAEAVADLCARSDVDLISVHSPPFLHLDHVRRAIEAGHDVLCDKPFGRNAAEAAEMRDIALAAGVLHFLNFENRYDSARRAVHDAVIGGVIGTPDHYTNTALMAMTPVPLRRYGWLFDAELGGGWLRAMGSHQIDFVRWTFGDIAETEGQSRISIMERPDKEGGVHRCTAEDGFVLNLRTERGVTAMVNSTSAAPVNVASAMLVVGTEGVIEDVGGRIVMRTTDGETNLFVPEAGANAMLGAQQRFCEVIRDAHRDREIPAGAATFDDGVACNIAMDPLGRPPLS